MCTEYALTKYNLAELRKQALLKTLSGSDVNSALRERKVLIVHLKKSIEKPREIEKLYKSHTKRFQAQLIKVLPKFSKIWQRV